jgi:tetratricopeptide (TPR) repeat protein
LASGYAEARNYEMALDQFKKTIDLDPTFASAHDNLGLMYRDMGKYDLWLEESKKAASLANDKERLGIFEEAAKIYTKSGNRAALARVIELKKQLAIKQYVDPAEIAFDYAELGDRQQTFIWLKKAYAEKSDFVTLIKSSKSMDKFRSDPEYKDLVKRMGLPQ